MRLLSFGTEAIGQSSGFLTATCGRWLFKFSVKAFHCESGGSRDCQYQKSNKQLKLISSNKPIVVMSLEIYA